MKFKIGDRVQVIKQMEGTSESRLGDIGIIKGIDYNETLIPYVVRFKDTSLWYSEDCLDMVDEYDEEAEAELILINKDKELIHKAKQYDKICEMLFMTSGIIDDGDSFKYIIDPETICDELIKVILKDYKLDREKIVNNKKEFIKGMSTW